MYWMEESWLLVRMCVENKLRYSWRYQVEWLKMIQEIAHCEREFRHGDLNIGHSTSRSTIYTNILSWMELNAKFQEESEDYVN